MGRKLSTYKGRLSPAEIANGINASRKNARRLWQDAQTLMQAARWPSAVALAILSIEESGKGPILRRLAVAKDDDEVSACWREYRSHARKNVNWPILDLFARGARRLEDFRPLYEQASEHPILLDQLKQLAFYSDCLGHAHWSSPEDVVDEPLAKALVEVAGLLCSHAPSTITEIELWIKHTGPVWGTTESAMQQALVDWYADMQLHGLADDGANLMQDFIYHGLGMSDNSGD